MSANRDDAMLPPTTPPGILASIASETLSALAGPMERVGMSPLDWFRVTGATARPAREKEY
jgi:hypothetical protein